jgi:hypothetical protein
MRKDLKTEEYGVYPYKDGFAIGKKAATRATEGIQNAQTPVTPIPTIPEKTESLKTANRVLKDSEILKLGETEASTYLDELYLKKELSDVDNKNIENISRIAIEKEWGMNEDGEETYEQDDFNDDGYLGGITDSMLEDYQRLEAEDKNKTKTKTDVPPIDIQFKLGSKEREAANQQLDQRMVNLMGKYNVKTQEVDSIKKQYGIDAVGIADSLNKLITVNKDRDLTTIPEESVHIAVSLIGEAETNPSPIQKKLTALTNDIESWDGFAAVEAQYNEAYKGDKTKIRREAVAKLITQSLVEKNASEQTLTGRAKAFIQDIINWVKTHFGNKNAIQIYQSKKVASHILKGKIDSKAKTTNKDVMLQKSIGINISSYEEGLGKKLTNFARLSVKFRGKTYDRAEDAYQQNKTKNLSDVAVKELMVEVLIAKLSQYPALVSEIDSIGGIEALNKSTHNLIKAGKEIKTDRWTGKDGLFMQALREAYSKQTKPAVDDDIEVAPLNEEEFAEYDIVDQEQAPLPVEVDPAVEAKNREDRIFNAPDNIPFPEISGEILQEVEVITSMVKADGTSYEMATTAKFILDKYAEVQKKLEGVMKCIGG